MTISADEFAAGLLHELALDRTAGFSGLGLVFYRDLSALPHMPLSGPDCLRPPLPVSGIKAIVSALSTAADVSSPWHDGFHFIDIEARALTHLSQFLAPALTDLSGYAGNQWPSGARQAAAVLTSLLNGIDCVGLVGQTGGAWIYRSGKQQLQRAA